METNTMTASKAKNETEEVPDLPVWQFDTPKTLRGTLQRIRSVNTTGVNGEPFSYPLLFVQPEGESHVVLVHAFPESLLSELRAVRPAPGDPIQIEYQGQKTTKQNRKARIFEVNGDKVSAYDWDAPAF